MAVMQPWVVIWGSTFAGAVAMTVASTVVRFRGHPLLNFATLADVIHRSPRLTRVVAALPWCIPATFLLCMAVCVVEYMRLHGFSRSCPAPDPKPAGYLSPRCELPILEISTYAAVPGQRSDGATAAFMTAAVLILIQAALLCPVRVALLEVHGLRYRASAATRIKHCCLCCIPSHLVSLFCARAHLACLAVSMAFFIATAATPCCEEQDNSHRFRASVLFMNWVFALIFDVVGCTQLLRAGVHPLLYRPLLRANVLGSMSLVIGLGFSGVWTCKAWTCTGEDGSAGWSDAACSTVFASEWLMVISLFCFFLPWPRLMKMLLEADRSVRSRSGAPLDGSGGASSSTSTSESKPPAAATSATALPVSIAVVESG